MYRFLEAVKVEGNLVYLPKTGWVRFRKSREIQGTIKQTTVIKEAGRWYVCFSCEIEVEVQEQELDLESVVGIDVGLTKYATLAIGNQNHFEEVANPRFLRKARLKLSYLHKNLSRKKLKSANWYKALYKLQRFYCWLKNCRKDFAHKLSTRIVKSHDIIGVENLSVSSLMQSGQTALVRSISDASLASIFTMSQI